MRKQFHRSTLSALMFSVAACWAAAATADDFYKGKTIRLIVATTPGGGFDAYSRTLTRHMGKHVPGNPTFVVENMPGPMPLLSAHWLHGRRSVEFRELRNALEQNL